MPTALDNGRRSPRKLLRAVVALLLGRTATTESTTLEIGVEPGAKFLPDPWEVFGPLRPEAEELTWVMWGWMHASAKMDADVHLGELEERVNSSPFGVPISWESLSGLLSELVQIVDGNFIGCRDPSQVPRFPETDLRTLHRTSEIVVTAFDSGCWFVSAPPSVIQRVRLAFPHAEERGVPQGLHRG
jgi:hypothetical protein